MNPKSLRIGNQVDWNGETAIISQLLESEVVFKCGEMDLYESIKPVLLIEEMLMNYGFNEFYILEIGLFKIEYSVENKIFYLNDIGLKLKYLHQLQNLYFALTGEEIKIKLWKK